MKLKALVIDDSRVMRNMVMQALTKSMLAEFEFVEAGDGVEALARMNADTFDIAFVDWNMPNMTGIDFVRQVRGLPNTDHIPLIMVTSEKTMGKIQQAMDDAGANAYICKPFTPQEMREKLQTIVECVFARLDGEQKTAGGFFSRLFN